MAGVAVNVDLRVDAVTIADVKETVIVLSPTESVMQLP